MAGRVKKKDGEEGWKTRLSPLNKERQLTQEKDNRGDTTKTHSIEK